MTIIFVLQDMFDILFSVTEAVKTDIKEYFKVLESPMLLHLAIDRETNWRQHETNDSGTDGEIGTTRRKLILIIFYDFNLKSSCFKSASLISSLKRNFQMYSA